MAIMVYTTLRPETTMDPRCRVECFIADPMLSITMTTNTSNNILQSILDKEKLSGKIFLDWHRNLRIVLKHDKKLYVLETPVPEEEPSSSAPKAERDAYKKHVDDANETACLMLATMNS
ncbi:hypothetical protein KIW84_024140 [Lathyrus oleraceus]|uniref:Uncharacterized protein n=1 Tax=Pisum sativum TaxID=3888 RepID=A0A9D4YFS4_PEA|nr:hypothetical protein KIW84_024140 [Pisum sativum]